MTDVEAVVQRYYGDRPVLRRIDEALRAAGVDPERPSHRDLWPFDQLHSRGIVATREHRNVRAFRPPCTCSISAAASAGRRATSRPNAVVEWRRRCALAEPSSRWFFLDEPASPHSNSAAVATKPRSRGLSRAEPRVRI